MEAILSRHPVHKLLFSKKKLVLGPIDPESFAPISLGHSNESAVAIDLHVIKLNQLCTAIM